MIVSTTLVALHPENETRLLSLSATDTSDQTKLVLSRLAADDLAEPDFSRWHELQVWLAAAEHRVAIPYAKTLADLVPPVAVRLRRDFLTVLSLIRAHAILHQASRARDADGKVIATLEDYAIVRELVVDLVSEGVEATVPLTVRETVQAVSARASEEGVSITVLARALNLDKASASRRWNNARARGYLKNLETGRGKPARIVVTDPLPDDIEVLPNVDELRRNLDKAQGQSDPLPPPPLKPHQHTGGERLGDRVDPSVADAEGASEASHGPSLAQALVDPELFHALGLDVYGAVLDPRPEARVPSGCPAGELIGTCMLCGGGVGDQDWIFGAWGRTSWRFSGHTLPGAVQLATLRPLLCSYCAVRLKHKLIPAPDPDDQLEARQ